MKPWGLRDIFARFWQFTMQVKITNQQKARILMKKSVISNYIKLFYFYS